MGILTLLPYGCYLDQDSEQSILFANIKEYLLHLPGDTRALRELSDYPVPEISINIDRDQGMAVYYPAFPVWYINRLSPYWGSVFWHLYTFLLVFWGMCSLFYLGKELFHREKAAAFLVLLFFLTPRMFAESHYNNKDVVLLSLTFTLFYRGKRLMEKQSFKNVCLFSIVGAFAANVKIIGAWLFGALGLYLLFYFIITKQFHGKLPVKTAGCILLWAAAVYLLILAAGICHNFPQEHSYYNFLSGKNVEARYELDYWDMSVKQAYESVLKANKGAKATVGALNLSTRWGLDINWEVLPKEARDAILITEKWQDAEYVIVNTTYAHMYTYDEYNWVKQNYDLADFFVSYGNVICEIYQRRPLP